MKPINGLQKISYGAIRLILALIFIFSGVAFEAQPVARASGVSVPAYSSTGHSNPSGEDTSAFLIGKVAVGVVFPESAANGLTDENWTPEEKTAAMAEISAGVARWSTLMTGASSQSTLEFVVEDINTTFTGSNSETTYEPIKERTPIDINNTNAYAWIDDVLNNYSLLTTTQTPGTKLAADERMYKYINILRGQKNADWGIIIFVVDSSLDNNNTFASNDFFYSDLYGPYTMVSFDAGASNAFTSNYLDKVISREVAHIFGASYHDYCFGPSVKFGYLAIADANCEQTTGSLMDSLVSVDMSATPDNVTLQQVGWRDSDTTADGIFDPVDTKPVVVMTPYTDPTYNPVLNYQNDATHTYKAYDAPYPPVACTAGDECYSVRKSDLAVTINTIVSIKFQVDGGVWTDVTAFDGLLDTDYELYNFETASLSAGQHSISVQATNSAGIVGNQSFIVTDKVNVVGNAVNDLFGSAMNIDALPYVDIVNIELAGIQDGDPTTSFCNQNRQGLQSVWYKYYADTDVPIYLDTIGSDYDTYIAVWTGSALDTLQPYPVPPTSNCDDDSGPGLQSELMLMPVVGQTYYIEVAKYGEGKGGLSGGELHFRVAINSFAPVTMWTTDFNYNAQGWRVEKHPRLMGDVNGDGKDDIIGYGYDGVWVALSTGTDFEQVRMWTTDYSYTAQGWRTELHPRMVGDVNGDGMDDAIGFGYSGVWVGLSTGNSFAPVTMWTTDFNYNAQGWRVEKHPRLMGDVNGDGKDDIIGYGYDGVWVALSTGTDFEQVRMWTTDYSYTAQGWRTELHPRMVGDVNGDGKDDAIGFGYSGVWVGLSTGNSFAPVTMWTTDFNYNAQGWRVEKHPRMMGDVNGDGKDDIIGYGYDGVWVALSTGTGFSSVRMWTTDYSYTAQGWRIELHPRMVGDVNGDGKDDAVGFGYSGVWVGTSQ